MSRNPQPIESLLLPLKPESLQCIHRFMEYERVKETRRFPKNRTAAVAIILFIGRLGDLYVLLSTRAEAMRTFAKDTALPGGKYEPGDKDEEATARREAFEEIGLPIGYERVRCLCLLDPFLTGIGLIVTPVVLLVTDNAINPVLNPSEVSYLFSMPLSAFLHDHPSRIPGWHFGISSRVDPGPFYSPPPIVEYADDAGEVGGKEGRYYGYRDVRWGPGIVRMHRFLTGREADGIKPVFGLTSAILIRAAMIGYDTQPAFKVHAPGQASMLERIEWEIRNGTGPLRQAVLDDGLMDDWAIRSKL
ncbi:NUDIX hydrolase domain-like protein [Kockovaella imperatae]|uniref:NUDIX hydrolase domain-like protein n=1 Tax=Kockovaella imperatae TaxID=4999 RepID=A0A1Y1U7L1_9TREE|nr:NUDIX hydrolase domain-like protein [Kockovaella imperatae]ORX34002.1 NUDIX hydrolase domain-like protein [Kockovaella imperatae]